MNPIHILFRKACWSLSLQVVPLGYCCTFSLLTDNPELNSSFSMGDWRTLLET